MNRRVSIVGDGFVGSAIAYTFQLKEIVDEVVLVDCNYQKSYADSLDMEHSKYFFDSHTTVRAGDKNDYKDSDFIIVTAAIRPPKGCSDRIAMLEPTKKILKDVYQEIKESGFNGYLIIVSNPVDIMTYYGYKITGLSKNKVIGTGTFLDTGRLLYTYSKEEHVSTKSISGMMMIGEHGESSVGVFSNSSIGGKPLNDLKDDKEKQAKIVRDVKDSGFVIMEGKNNTCYGIAACVYRLVKAIIIDENMVIPVSHVLDGEEVSISLPCVINAKGIDRVIDLELSNDEKEKFDKSKELLKGYCSKLF